MCFSIFSCSLKFCISTNIKVCYSFLWPQKGTSPVGSELGDKPERTCNAGLFFILEQRGTQWPANLDMHWDNKLNPQHSCSAISQSRRKAIKPVGWDRPAQAHFPHILPTVTSGAFPNSLIHKNGAKLNIESVFFTGFKDIYSRAHFYNILLSKSPPPLVGLILSRATNCWPFGL